MKIWLVAEGEPLPCDNNPRLMRMGMLAEYLSTHGHKVVWWSSTFIHGKKDYLFKQQKIIDINENEKLFLLHSKVSYRKNISLSRIIYLQNLSKEFRKECEKQEKPDVILCSWPTQEFAREAVRYGKKNNVPVILDARDEWPDIFTRAFPKGLSIFGKILLSPLMNESRRIFSKADAVTGVQSAIWQWALDKAGRKAHELDQVIYIGQNNGNAYTEDEIKKAINDWNEYGVTENTWNIAFFSSFSKTVIDYDTIFTAVKELSHDYPKLRFIFCGDGDGMPYAKNLSRDCNVIILPGWCNDLQIKSLLSISNIGLYPLKNLEDFKDAIGNKFVGYLAAGLPVLSDLEGLSKKYIEDYEVGLTYKEGDVESCKNAIIRMVQNDDLMKKYGENARKRFAIDFDSNIVNSKFEKLFSDIIERRKLKK